MLHRAGKRKDGRRGRSPLDGGTEVWYGEVSVGHTGASGSENTKGPKWHSPVWAGVSERHTTKSGEV
jgi:hypothetical protein